MDDIGIGLSICTNTQVLASPQNTRAYVNSPEDREWVSIAETASILGRKMQPFVVLKGNDP